MTSTPRGSPDWILSADGPIEAEAGAVVEIPVRLMAEESRLKSRSTPVTLVLIAADDRLSVREEARFYPVSPRRWAALRPTSGPGRQAQICRCLPSFAFAAGPEHRAMTHYRPFNIVTT
jgi:hypothetical protein